jgi:hypothetical protein
MSGTRVDISTLLLRLQLLVTALVETSSVHPDARFFENLERLLFSDRGSFLQDDDTRNLITKMLANHQEKLDIMKRLSAV